MGALSNKIPKYVYEKPNIVQLILLTALFALVFINIYKPFSSSNWYPVSELKLPMALTLSGLLLKSLQWLCSILFTRLH